MHVPPLLGAVVGVTADRRSDEQCLLLERRGAWTLRGAPMRVEVLHDDEVIGHATRAVIDDPPSIVVMSTAAGIQGWLTWADAHMQGEELRRVLASTDLRVRGPKALGAVTGAGLRAPEGAPESLAQIARSVIEDYPQGARIAVELDGAGGYRTVDLLRCHAFEVVPIRIRTWDAPRDRAAAETLVRAAAERRLDAITFTSVTATQHFAQLADHLGLLDEVRAACDSATLVACLSKRTATAAEELGLTSVIVAEQPRLGSLVAAVAVALARPPQLTLCGSDVLLRRTQLVIDGAQVEIPTRERDVLEVLVAGQGSVISKTALARAVWRTPVDDHTVEVTIARLRRRLGKAGRALETVTRRGYRLRT